MLTKKSFARLIRICTGTFGTGKDEHFSQHDSFTKLEKFCHFWVLVWQSFVRNRCPVRASALSYTTLLALIPMLVVAMSLSSWLLKSKGEEQIGAFIEQFIIYVIPNRPPSTNAEPATVESRDTNIVATLATTNAPTATNAVAGANSATNTITALVKDSRVVAAKDHAASQIREFIQNANSKALGSVGAIMLLWTAILMLSRIEDTFNDIWGVTRGRNWLSRIVLYWATITLGPILLTSAIGLATGQRFQKTRDMMSSMPFMEPLVSQLLPVVMICFTFAMLYKLVPNTKVSFRAAFVGGTFAGITWCLFNLISLHFATSWVTANAIYGSLALVPLLMVGLYTVWVIVLFGGQVAYAYQNRESYVQERLAENVNQRGREFVALRLMTCISERFQRGLPPTTTLQLSRELGIPTKLVQQVLRTLIAARLVVEITGQEGGYTPARPIDTINCHHILLAMRATQGQELVTRDEPVRTEVLGEFARIQAAEKAAASTVSMLTLVSRTQSRLEIAPAGTNPDKLKSATTLVEPMQEIEPVAPPADPDSEPIEMTFTAKEEPAKSEKKSPPPPARVDDDDQSFPL